MEPIQANLYQSFLLNQGHLPLKKQDVLILFSLQDTFSEDELNHLLPASFQLISKVHKAVKKGWIEQQEHDGQGIYHISDKGRRRLPAHPLVSAWNVLQEQDEAHQAHFSAVLEQMNAALLQSLLQAQSKQEELPTHCPKCSNHCKRDHLRCKRGERYFEELRHAQAQE